LQKVQVALRSTVGWISVLLCFHISFT